MISLLILVSILIGNPPYVEKDKEEIAKELENEEMIKKLMMKLNKTSEIMVGSFCFKLEKRHVLTILAPDVSNSKTKSGNGLSEIDILQQS